ncbi:MAG: hypothetical protein ACRD01_14030 [Terriglobales bacterium]
MNPEMDHDNRALDQLLDRWQTQPEPSAGFKQRLDGRVQTARRLRQLRQRAAVAVCALVLVATGVWLVHTGAEPGAGNSTAAVQVANMEPMVQDLKTMSLEGDLLQHMDFLNAKAEPSRSQQ